MTLCSMKATTSGRDPVTVRVVVAMRTSVGRERLKRCQIMPDGAGLAGRTALSGPGSTLTHAHCEQGHGPPRPAVSLTGHVPRALLQALSGLPLRDPDGGSGRTDRLARAEEKKPAMFERFTDRARRVVVLAQDDVPEQVSTIARKLAELRRLRRRGLRGEGVAVRPR